MFDRPSHYLWLLAIIIVSTCAGAVLGPMISKALQ
jgi:hypothetical protein